MKNDIAYSNADFIPNAEAIVEQWAEDARAFRELEAAIGRARLNHSYGVHPREKLDLFYPAGRPEGLVAFVHGGYWLRFDRTDWSHFARGLTTRGWAVAIPSYPLAPEVSIAEITRSVARAVEAAAALISGPIRLVGHSAGGHLAARVVMEDVPMPCQARVEKLIALAPIADLHPLMKTTLNDRLGLNADQCATESPALAAAPNDLSASIWVGAEERPAFLNQAQRLAEVWSAEYRVAAGRHHFDLLDDLEHADSPLVNAILDP